MGKELAHMAKEGSGNGQIQNLDPQSEVLSIIASKGTHARSAILLSNMGPQWTWSYLEVISGGSLGVTQGPMVSPLMLLLLHLLADVCCVLGN